MKIGYALSALIVVAMTGAAHAQTSVKLGVLNDRSGVYSDLTGEGSVIAARMAVEDFKAAEKGIKVEVVAADHQNKPDIGASIARQWYDQDGVDGACRERACTGEEQDLDQFRWRYVGFDWSAVLS
jgi:branched-chain amino acid transport system substrate-binding protein